MKPCLIKSLEMSESDTLKDFIIFQTKHNYCNCKNLNPSKQCWFCSMKITQEIKTMDKAEIAKINAIQVEMDNKSAEFLANDSEIYMQEILL
jgi:hypothetical protein